MTDRTHDRLFQYVNTGLLVMLVLHSFGVC